MDVNVDVGKNLTSLLERLAEQIGTTADKVFPWYVQQAYLEGATTFVGIAFFLLLSSVLFIWSVKKADFSGGDLNNRYAIIFVASCVMSFFSLIGTAFEGIEAARKMLNPNYYAMSMLTRDVGRMVAR
jgi:hypothetical protein